MVKNLPANAGDAGDLGSIPGSESSVAGGNGNPLQYYFFIYKFIYSYLENPMDRGAWGATVHGVAKSQTQHDRTEPNTTTACEGMNGRQGSRQCCPGHRPVLLYSGKLE